MTRPTTDIVLGHDRDGTKLQATFPETFRDRFYGAKSRSRDRQGLETMTNAEFVTMLLDVWEEYEEPRRDDG